MQMTRRTILGAASVAAIAPFGKIRAQTRPVIRIGVINDQSGPYRDVNGPTSIACTKQAVQEFAAGSFDVEVLSADHQNKPDIGASKFREWTDQSGLNMLLGEANTGVSIAIAKITATKKVPFFPISVSMATFLDGDSVVGGRVS